MILGTFKIFDFFGPVVDPRTPYFSWIYFEKYKKIWEDPGENIIYGNMWIDIFNFFEISETLGVHFWILEFQNSWIFAN